MIGSHIALVLICLASYAFAKYFSNCKGRGHWEESQQPNYPVHASRIVHNFTSSDESSSNWRRDACPLQSTTHSCYYHGDIQRARILEYRVWVLEDSTCRKFWPLDFLLSVRNRSVVFIGDSVMGQVFQSLVCSLHQLTPTRLTVGWNEDTKNALLCPFGEVHCHHGNSKVLFPLLNTTLLYRKSFLYTTDNLFDIIDSLNLTSTDIIVFNYGLHYTDIAAYERDLIVISDRVRLHQESSPRQPWPYLLFLQSTPQHFSSRNGYFEGIRTAGKYCSPLSDVDTIMENVSSSNATEWKSSSSVSADWRNIISERVFKNHPSIVYVEIAAALYSQYDAHIDGFNRFRWFTVPDCTHWCFPSGVFDYILRLIFNSMLDSGAAEW